jgi:hypothetical protein
MTLAIGISVTAAATAAVWWTIRHRTLKAGPVVIVYGLVIGLGWAVFVQSRHEVENRDRSNCLTAVIARDDNRRQWTDTYSYLEPLSPNPAAAKQFYDALRARLDQNLPALDPIACPNRVPLKEKTP